ncbi:T3SS (YopN, CesT) and YbjN peptide-binding chaperone 1 [Rhodococcus sp. NPDC003322]
MTEHDHTDDQPLQLDGAFAVATEDRDQLHALCVRALTELLGEAPETDEDGDIVIPVHGFGVFVTVADDGPQLHVWSSLLDGLTDTAKAAEQLVELAHEWPRLRFVLDDGHLLASTIVDADPFAPQHLLNLVDELHDLTHELDDDFADRFGGTLDCDADDDSYAGECGAGGCGCGDCGCGDAGASGDLGDTIPVGAPQA